MKYDMLAGDIKKIIKNVNNNLVQFLCCSFLGLVPKKVMGEAHSSFLRKDLRFVWFLQIEEDSFPRNTTNYNLIIVTVQDKSAAHFQLKHLNLM